MKVEVLMSVMNQTDMSIGHQSHVDTDLLIINQCDHDDYMEQIVDGHLWRMISTTERGLSKSRNMAIKNARGEICLLADDDEEYKPNTWTEIAQAFDLIPDAAAIVFNVDRINYAMKKDYYRIIQTREVPAYRGYGSVQMAFRLDVIKTLGLVFNEKFGSGTEWGGGEDILFQNDIKRYGLKIYESPACIATIDYAGGSQWFHGYNEKYFYNVGAFNGYVNNGHLTIKSLLYTIYQCFYKLRKDKTMNPFKRIIWKYRGFKGIQKDVTYSQYLEQHK